MIVDPNNRVLAVGYNGPPTGLVIVGDCSLFCHRGAHGPTDETVISYADCSFVHSELNALGFCDRTTREGGTLYVTGALCWTCAKAVANSGLARVVIGLEVEDRSYRAPDTSTDLLVSCGLEVGYV